MKNKTKWITQTGILLALLIVVQLVTKSLGQLATGSFVNLILSIGTFVGGLSTGITLSVISPVIAFILGIGPAFLPIVPCICLGNSVLCFLLWLMSQKLKIRSDILKKILAVVSASICKFGVLYLFVVIIVLPLLGLPEAKSAVISLSFSWTQLITALIGSTIATIISPVIKKGVNKAFKA